MEFGIFDHLDWNQRDLTEHYEDRLKLLEVYDRGIFFTRII